MAARKDLNELSILEVRMEMMDWMDRLKMDPAFAERHLNDGFSGGERKRNEILQMALLDPTMAILDETDSGLDIDALQIVADGVATVRTNRPDMGVLVVTHYQRLLNELAPDHVHLLIEGRVVASGGPELALEVEKNGYEKWQS
jgi:Fe-S cluster assembly ATP-binding protein